ncbi:MAG: response regulator transcription factor [Armatimonadota bacterium]
MAVSERILLIEDEAPIADSVSYSLQNEGFDVRTASDGVQGLSLFRSFSPDLIILDLMLPKLGGLEFCKMVRKESSVPIIMLTAKNEEVDRVIGLELGADDYIPKPFSTRELIARVRAVLRRVQSTHHKGDVTKLSAGPIEMDLVRRRVTVDEQNVHLPLKQFELLKALLINKDKVLTRDDLVKMVWDVDADVDSGSLDVHIRWLREKVEKDPGNPRYIKTIRGVGYKIVSGDGD